MTFETTRDVLDHVRAVHSEISQMYAAQRDESRKGRVKLLLDFMSRHEEHLSSSLSTFEENASAKVLDTWFQYAPDEAMLEDLTCFECHPEMNIDDLIRLAMRLDGALIRFYARIAEQAQSTEIRELFTSLVELEEQEQVRMQKNALDIRDL